MGALRGDEQLSRAIGLPPEPAGRHGLPTSSFLARKLEGGFGTSLDVPGLGAVTAMKCLGRMRPGVLGASAAPRRPEPRRIGAC
jgi:hypothetical protein